MSQLKVGDRVKVASVLSGMNHWTEAESACRHPGAEGKIVRIVTEPGDGAALPDAGDPRVLCDECQELGCYVVEHKRGSTGYYHGDELTPIRRKGEPRPGDDDTGAAHEKAAKNAQHYCVKCGGDMIARPIDSSPTLRLVTLECGKCSWRGAIMELRLDEQPEPDEDSGRIGDRVDALAEELRQLREFFRAWQSDVCDQLEQLAKQPEQPPSLGDVIGPLQNDPYLSQAVADWEEAGAGPKMAKMLGHLDRGCAKTFDAIATRVMKLEQGHTSAREEAAKAAALRADVWWRECLAELLGLDENQPIPDGESLLMLLASRLAPPPPPMADDALDAQPSEPSHAALLWLWRRLSSPDAYDVRNPGALANVALGARAGVGRLSEQLTDLQRRHAPLMRLLEVTTMQQRSEIAAALRLTNRNPESPARLVADMLDALDKEQSRGH